MLFSALVDADRMDAMLWDLKQQNPHDERVSASVGTDLLSSFNPRSLSEFNPQSLPLAKTKLDRLRNVFAQYCITAASSPKGLFRLTGACGIGKTESSLRFALIHAQHNTMPGIIYVGPLKSIIEQTAITYGKLLGQKSVLEHHSGFYPEPDETKDYKLDTERWDKPFIVTSGVQFYESLFSNQPSQCRKLHNIANRVILIDEAQTIPLELANSILDVLETLIKDWGCTVVLMSATQPAFNKLKLCHNATDIVPNDKVTEQFQQLDRVTYRITLESPWTWQNLAEDITLSGFEQSLTVVNTTKLAREGYQELSNLVSSSWFHLSARMCPAHRDRILQQVRSLLDDKLPCHLISTQLIEAGVDIDFPRAYRQLGPLDSIIQTSGRCNRNNKLSKQEAVVTVFEKQDANQASGNYQNRINMTRNILTYDPQALEHNLLNSIRQYFLQLYSKIHAGGKKIQELRSQYKYPEVAKEFQVIDDSWQQSVVVPWEEGADLIAELRNKEVLTEQDWRRVQRYTVGVPLKYTGITECPNGLKIVSDYSSDFGLYLDTSV